MAKLSKTEWMWLARLKKGPRRQQYDRLTGRGLVERVETRDARNVWINVEAAALQAARGLVLP